MLNVCACFFFFFLNFQNNWLDTPAMPLHTVQCSLSVVSENVGYFLSHLRLF